ncbi:winged helix-turn-helix domain-containing protein [Christensenellaceae bacterium OttesenSCG-928-M15]|nr:winged helix-turn-helix domain-containing protein [Christensenellaceae bacterium OttesenSCG-928-M15]
MENGGERAVAYRQLCADLFRAIAKGWYAPGTRLPTEDHLCEATALSKGTVRMALKELEDMEFVRRIRGSGTYVEPDFILRRWRYANKLVQALFDSYTEQKGYSPVEVYKLFMQERVSLLQPGKNTQIAFVDCTPEAFRCVIKQLEQFHHFKVTPYTVDDAQVEGRVPSSPYAMWLTTGTHYAELEHIAWRRGIRLEWVELSISSRTAADIVRLSDTQMVGVIYQSENFLRNVRFNMHNLQKFNGLYPCPIQDWQERLKLADAMDIVFVVPPTLQEDIPEGEHILSCLRGLRKKVVVFEYQIDQGSLVKLRRRDFLTGVGEETE